MVQKLGMYLTKSKHCIFNIFFAVQQKNNYEYIKFKLWDKTHGFFTY